MATLIQIRDKANAVLAPFWTALQEKQDIYFSKHNKYFQLLITDEVTDGVDTTFEIRQPNDELHPLDMEFSFSSPIPFSISVDEWVGPNSRGYSATATIKLLDGRIFRRTRDSDQQDTGWYELINDV